jgi:hypothetical protein
MKKRRKSREIAAPLAPGELTDIFVRGAVAAGLLAAIQDRWTVGKPSGRKVMRLALQGGVALAAGAAGAESLRDRDYLGALVSCAVGALGVATAETLLESETSASAGETDIG